MTTFKTSREIGANVDAVFAAFRDPARLAITLEPSSNGTLVSWSQAFDSARVGERLQKIVVPANEENLDRLTAEVLAL